MDTADAKAINNSESNETIFTPAGRPGVLNDPVFLAILGAPADGEDGVVKGGSASCAGNDTTSVALENSGVGLDGDGDGASGNGVLEGS